MHRQPPGLENPPKGTHTVNTKKVVALCAAMGVTVAGLSLATPAFADPVSNSVVLVGSDTLQDVSNALANGTSISGASVRVTSNGNTIGSYDAFGSTSIQTKPSGPYFARPSGSGDGVKALSRSIDGANYSSSGNSTPAVAIAGQIDIARSSSGPGAATNASGALEYFPFARDAVSYAFLGTGLDQLTTSQLTQIYQCTLTVVNGTTVIPVLPQAASGTRKFFLSAIGNPTLGACVQQTTFAENDGTVLTTAGQLIPFSVASWIAQKNVTPAPDRTGSAILGSAEGATAPYTGTGTNLSANPTYYADSTWGRDTYVVVEYARVDPSSATFDANLSALMDPTKAKSLTNFGSGSATAGAVKKKFGFLAPSSTTPIRANLS
jgi:ABC-type phosphate transport system substrate-binding protein